MMTAENIGIRIRQLRLERGWKQFDFEEVGLSIQRISDIEKGKIGIGIYTLNKILQHLGVEETEFFNHNIFNNENRDRKKQKCKATVPLQDQSGQRANSGQLRELCTESGGDKSNQQHQKKYRKGGGDRNRYRERRSKELTGYLEALEFLEV